MHIHELAKAYETKTDEELQQLATDSGQLTHEAQAALKSELAKRRIDGVERLIAEQSSPSRIEQRSSHEAPLAHDSHEVGEFVTEVLRVYHDHLWLFIKLTVPAVVIGYIAVIMGRNEGREIARHLPRDIESLGHTTEILQIWLVNFSGYIVSWIAFSISFAAICSAVGRVAAGGVPSVADSFAKIRERTTSFLRLALLLFVLFLVAEVAASLFSTGVFWVLRQRQVHLTSLTFQVVSFGSVGLALVAFSRFGLAIPAFILGNCRVGQAMFRSDELTEGKWLTLTVLLAKSLIGGYVAGMCPFWLASWIPANIPLPSWLPWVLTVASIMGVTVVEPTMFIGFALLYSRMSSLSSTSSQALPRQLA
jgi:hypothetical protein